MEFKEVRLLFGEVFAGLDVELRDDNYVFCLTEYEENAEKTTETNTTIEPRSSTEVYLGREEVLSIVKSLMFLLGEEDC